MKSVDLSRIVRDRLLALGAEPGDRCLVALSGGQDSTALLLAMLSGWGESGLTVAAHLNHAVRQGSEREQSKVEELCRRLGVELRTGRLDPGEVSLAAKRTGSLEAAMRTCRYRFLEISARSLDAKWLLTGHTADDQVETVLFRILRRMDPMSFSGIPERRSRVIRPLLEVSREVTRRYCTENGIEPLLDPSNNDYSFTRNRIRHHTLPALRSTFHPDLDEHVLRLSSLVRRMDELEEEILYSGDFPVVDKETGILSIPLCRRLPDPLRESAVVRFLHMATGRRPSRSLIREAVEHLWGGKQGRMSLPGGKIMDYDRERTYIYSSGQNEPFSIPEDPVRLSVPGRVRLEGPDVSITAEYGALEEPKRFPAGDTVLILKKGLREPLWVRKRRPGDRFDPLGSGGEKKLKDFFIDRKIPLYERERTPLVLDNGGEILWVAGIEISSKAALEGYKGEEAVILKLEKAGCLAQGKEIRKGGFRDTEGSDQEKG